MCCNDNGKDGHLLEEKVAEGKPIKLDPKISEEQMQVLKKSEKKIIKIQAVWRGFSCRKRLKIEDHISQRPRASGRRSNRPPKNGGAVARQK